MYNLHILCIYTSLKIQLILYTENQVLSEPFQFCLCVFAVTCSFIKKYFFMTRITGHLYDCFPMGLMYIVHVHVCLYIHLYIYGIICICLSLTRVCLVCVVKEVVSFLGVWLIHGCGT